jgi:hypothetical protein
MVLELGRILCKPMKDRRPVQLETESGMRPRSAISDRVLVGLAGIVLIGGMLVAAGNILRGDSKTASASLAPSSTESHLPTPTPRVLQLVQLEQGTPADVTAQSGFEGWVRAKADIAIRSGPVINAPLVATLRKGALAYAAQHDEFVGNSPWLNITEPEPGWIYDTDLVARYESSEVQVSGGINYLAAGPDGFLALGHPPDASNQSMSPYPIQSGDGIGWRFGSSDAFGGWDVSTATWGPAGWLAAGYVPAGDNYVTWLWSSADGLQWQSLGAMAGTDIGDPGQLVASDDGYLLKTGADERSGSPIFWFSADGGTWQETADPRGFGAANEALRAIGIPDGFYIWGGGSGPAWAAFSVNGRVWAKVDTGPEGESMQLIEAGSELLAIDADPDTGAPRVWVGAFDRRHVAWQRETGDDNAFAGAVVTALVWDGQRAYAFGWDRPTEQPLVWTRDADSWTRRGLPESFGGIPHSAAAGPAGVVVIGQRPTLRGDNPIMWHQTVTGSWLPEPRPIFEAVPNPTAAGCPSAPRDLAAFMVLDLAAAPVCFGDAQITMRAWSVRCQQCWGSGAGLGEPAWLVAPTTNQLYLSPIKLIQADEWSTSMILAPPVVWDPIANAGTWVELTGHFDDPAAATCRYIPAVPELPNWRGQQAIIDNCRQTFVVTGVRAVSGP